MIFKQFQYQIVLRNFCENPTSFIKTLLAMLRKDPKHFCKRIAFNVFSPFAKVSPGSENFTKVCLNKDDVTKKNIDNKHSTISSMSEGHIGQKNVHLPDFALSPSGLTTAFFYHEARTKEVRDLLNELKEQHDFACFSDHRLTTVVVADDITPFPNHSRYSPNEKKNISKVATAIFFETSSQIIEEWYYATEASHVIVIKNDSSNFHGSNYTSTLITTTKNASLKKEYRKVITLENQASLATAIRRAVQESLPKEHSLFIPVFGKNRYCRDELLEIDNNTYQAYLVLERSPKFTTPASCQETLNTLSGLVSELYVTTAVYEKYKTMCESITTDNLVTLLSYLLKDGILFYVNER